MAGWRKNPKPRPSGPSPEAAALNNEDIAREIASYLGRADILTLTTVSQAFHRAATPLLYRHLVESLPECYCRSSMRGRNPDHCADYTTTLELFPHRHYHHYNKPLDLPRLQTLVVNYDIHLKDAPEYHDANDNAGRSALHRCSHCPPLPYAPRVVLRPLNTVFNHVARDHKRIVLPWIDCDEAVIHIARLKKPNMHTTGNLIWNHPHKATPKRITFVLLPFYWDYGIGINKIKVRSDHRHTFAKNLIMIILRHVCNNRGKPIPVTMVGLEDANPFVWGEHWRSRERRKQETETMFDEGLSDISGGRDTKELKAFRKASKTMTFMEYLEGNHYGGELDWQLVGRWIKAYREREETEATTAVSKKHPLEVEAKAEAEEPTSPLSKKARSGRA